MDGMPDAGHSTAVPPGGERLFGGPLPSVSLDSETQAFQPEAYRRYYPDLGSNSSDDDLAAHYLVTGRGANRVAERLRVVATYGFKWPGRDPSPYGGLCNQWYIHISMMAILLQMGAEVVLPGAEHRGGRGYQDDFRANQIQFVSAPLDTLFDIEHLLAWGASAGAVLHTATAPLNRSIDVTVNGGSICCSKPLEEIVAILHGAVLDAVQSWIAGHPDRDPSTPLPPVALSLQSPYLLFALRTDTSHTDLIEEVSRNVLAAPRIRRLADVIVARLSASGVTFNGVHLRLEQDANWQDRIAGGQMALLTMYTEVMQASNCTAPEPLYVASGLLTYMNASDFDRHIASNLTSRGVCGDVFTKERLLTDGDLAGLLSESLGLLDLLVLVRARQFIGFAASTFSWMVQEQRCLQGAPQRSTAMVTLSGGPEEFASAALLSNHSRTCPE